MIDVRVREHDRINAIHRVGELPVFLRGLRAAPLKEPAVEENRAAIHLQEMARARDLAGGSREA
jgi:hypothetical protein